MYSLKKLAMYLFRVCSVFCFNAFKMCNSFCTNSKSFSVTTDYHSESDGETNSIISSINDCKRRRSINDISDNDNEAELQPLKGRIIETKKARNFGKFNFSRLNHNYITIQFLN